MKKLPRLTSRDRLGYIVFIFLIIISIFLLKLDTIFPSLSKEIAFQVDTTAYKRLQKEVMTWEKKYAKPNYMKDNKGNDTILLVYKPFDPNTADSVTLRQLGLSPFVSRNIINYRAKGGRFTSASVLARIYGMDSMTFDRIKPYINIDSAYLPKTKIEFKRDSFPQRKFAEITRVDLNTADTAILKKIPGIGEGISQQIIQYRQQLGGFVDVTQIKELKYMTDSVFEQLQPWLKIDNKDIKLIAVNRFGIERMRKHPYLNFYQCKAILEIRKKKGKLSSIRELSLLEEFTPDDLQRLEKYLVFD
ncbi:MAG: helix-hairpin-helix domain-containing protein [Bacteroidales bacterium]